MPQNPLDGYATVTPYLLYHDTDAAVEFLTRAFGFSERFRMAGANGKTSHAEVELAGGLIMLGTPTGEYRSPAELGGRTQVTFVYVADVDQHFQRAKAAGAHIARELADQFYGDRRYTAYDPEGHAWSFATRTRDLSDAEIEAAMAAGATD